MEKSLKTLIISVLVILNTTTLYCFSQQQMPVQTQTQNEQQAQQDQPIPKEMTAKVVGQETVGDYIIVLMNEPAKGWYAVQNGKLSWMPPASGTNQHIEVVLRDARDQRILPGSQVNVSIYDQNNKLTGTKQHVFLWSPVDFHYGENWNIPATGTYTIKVDILPPTFARHNKVLGARLCNPATYTFKNVKLENPGQVSE